MKRKQPIKRNLCSICSGDFDEFPCSAHPITDGQCCARCDDLIVTPIRMVRSAAPDVHATVVDMFRRAIAMRASKLKAIEQMKREKMSE
jgi:hypothetical protein